MNRFLSWLETLGWQQALIFLVCLCLVMCVLICGTDKLVRKLHARYEERLILRREIKRRREEKLREWELLMFPIERDESKRFYLPPSMRDMKDDSDEIEKGFWV